MSKTVQLTVAKPHRTLLLLSGILVLLPGCWGHDPLGPSDQVDVAAFRQLARSSDCAEFRNRLFLIDEHLVFWDRAGECADAAYSEMLYDYTPDQVLCSFHDSVSGSVRSCADPRYRDMFDTITAHLDESDLGLGVSGGVNFPKRGAGKIPTL